MDASLFARLNIDLELTIFKLEQNMKDHLDKRLDAFKDDLFHALRIKGADNVAALQTDPAHTQPPTTTNEYSLLSAGQAQPTHAQPPATLNENSPTAINMLIEASKTALDNAWLQLYANDMNKNEDVKKILSGDAFTSATQQIKKTKEMLDNEIPGTKPTVLSKVYEEVLFLLFARGVVCLSEMSSAVC